MSAVIHSVNGDILYESRHTSKRALIESLLEYTGFDDEGKPKRPSFRDADLRHLDMSRLDLSGLDFTGADLSGTKLNGVDASGTNFSHTTFRGVKADGMIAPRAQFVNANITPKNIRGSEHKSNFTGAILTYANFDGADITDASFNRVSGTGASFDMANLLKSEFTEAVLQNASFNRAHVLQCDFEDAILNAKTSAAQIPSASLPNRTVDATVIGNNYKNAQMDDTLVAFRWDKGLSMVTKQLAWGASTAAILFGSSLIPEFTGESLQGYLGQGIALVSSVTLVSLLKEKVSSFIQDKMADFTVEAQRIIRSGIIELVQRGANVGHMAAALVKGPGFGVLRRALAATHDDALRFDIAPLVKTLTTGQTNIILCDKSHLALALEWMSMSYNRTRLLDNDLIVSRINAGDDNAPTVIKFFAGGGMAAFWTDAASQVTRAMQWDHRELEPMIRGDASAVDGLDDLDPMTVRQMFEDALVRDHLPGVSLDYDRDSQTVRAGRDGSILVVNRSSHHLAHNEGKAVVIRPDGETLSRKQARLQAATGLGGRKADHDYEPAEIRNAPAR